MKRAISRRRRVLCDPKLIDRHSVPRSLEHQRNSEPDKNTTAEYHEDGAAVLLRLPGGTGWRLRAGGAKVDLAESIYFGAGGAKRTQQAVLSGRTDGDGGTVKWALRREGGKN